MQIYRASVEVASGNFRDVRVDAAMDALATFQPNVWQSDRGWAAATIRLPAESLAQAAAAAAAVVSAAFGGALAVACEVMTEDESEGREGWGPTRELLSVTEVAGQLGVSRQAVLQRIASGSLPARKVGRDYAISASALSGRLS